MKTMKITITPERAAKMLETMGKNRPMRSLKVSQMVNDMLSGNFKECPDLIAFDVTGKLINGQHRLSAVIQSGVTIKTWIAYDLSTQNTVIDIGSPRTVVDTGVLQGTLSADLANKKNVSAINAFMRVKLGEQKAKQMSSMMRIDAMNQYSDELIRIQEIIRGIQHPLCDRASVRAALLGAMLSGVDDEELSRFCDRTNTGILYGKEETAAGVFHEYLLNIRNKGRDDMNDITSIAEQAIYYFVNKKPRKKAFTPGPHPYINPDAEVANE